MSLYGRLARKGPSGFGYASTAEQVTEGLDLTGRRILVTGCNSGLGLETMRVLALRGATVVGAARTADKAATACASLSGSTVPVACELSEPASVRACVATMKAGPPLDAIICNAGIMALPTLQQKHGYELQFFTNHVGHFILVTGLLDHLRPDARVVILSSEAHRRAPSAGIEFDNLSGERNYGAWTAYGQAKLANLLFAKELAKRFEGTGKTANSVHPGVIVTNLGRHMGLAERTALAIAGPLALKSIPEGAATQTWAAVHPAAGKISGQYLSHSNIAEPTAHGQDAAMAARLWAETEKIVATV